jgi:hypothetical protein
MCIVPAMAATEPPDDLTHYMQATALARRERDFWVRLFNRLEVSITHHKKAKEYGINFVDEVDERLYEARDKILKAANEGPN